MLDAMTAAPADSHLPPEEFREGLFEYMTRHNADHVQLVDPQFRILYLNRAAPGTTIDEFIGTSLLDQTPEEIKDLVESKMRSVFDDGKTVRWEGMFDTPLGRRYYNTVVGPIVKDGEVVAAALLARDVTDLMNLQMQHATNSRLATLGELAAGVGHEINNPLMALTGHLLSVQDALDDAGVTDRSVHDKLRECEDSVARIARIVRGLRRFSRSRKGNEAFDVNQSIEETTEFLAGIFGFRSMTFELRFDEPNIYCLGDAAVFQQVLTNLFTNAKDALQGAKGGRVTVRTRREGEKVVIEVEDNGPGISKNIMPFIFDPFFSTNPNRSASGMGLTLSRSIVESMQGSIEARPHQDGALFRIELPYRAVKHEHIAHSTSWQDQKLERGRVLVVDDDETVLDAVSFLLEDLGFQVSSRSDPSEALRIIEEEDSFDIVISDRQMPGMSGEVFVQQADQRLRKTGNAQRPRYFLLSGWHDPDHDDSTQVKLGDIDIGLIGKPVTRAQLADHLSTAPPNPAR